MAAICKAGWERSLGHRKWSGPKQLPGDLDVIVIGSGMGGLSCAAVLSQFRYRVAVFEQHEVVGGGAHEFAVDGKAAWRFDSGLHYTVPQAQQLLQVACGACRPPVRVIKMGASNGVYDKILLGGLGGPELGIKSAWQLYQDLKQRYPNQTGAINRYFLVSFSVLTLFLVWVGSAILPHSLRRILLDSPLMWHWNRWAAKTAEEGTIELIPGSSSDAQQVRAFLSGLWIDTGSAPARESFFMQAAVGVGFPFTGGAFPEGGSHEMALSLVDAIENRGGIVFSRTPVSQIIIDARGNAAGIKLQCGDIVNAPLIISAVGHRATFGSNGLVTRSIPNSVVGKEMHDTLVTPQSDGFVMANIGLEGSATALGLECTNLWVLPSNVDNGWDIYQGIQDYFADPLGVSIDALPVMFTFPSVKDRSWPEEHNKSTVQILALAPGKWFEKHLDSNPWARHAPPHVPRADQAGYDDLKERWGAKLRALLVRHYPQLEGKIAFVDISTPLTMKHYLHAEGGSATGIDNTPARYVDLEEMRRLDMRSTIPGLWLTGQDVLVCGQPMVQLSGILTALRILGPLQWPQFGLRAFRLLLVGYLFGGSD